MKEEKDFWYLKMARTKRVTDPLGERVKNRIFGLEKPEPLYFSSGSEHSAQNEDDGDDSSCLSDLLYGFLPCDGDNDNEHDGAASPDHDSDSERHFSMLDHTDTVNGIVDRVLLSQSSDRYRNVLAANICKAMEVFSFVKSNKSLLLRNVMVFLRNLGFNAAVCKTKWEMCGGLAAGNYEFIDVVKADCGTRYFVDLEFAGEFEIARQTNQYRHLLQSLPRVFIGKSEDLKKVVKAMSDAARRSLKSRGLRLPPWRKNRFMQNKYFGPYRRTINFIPTNSSSSTSTKSASGVKCRAIGFNAVNGPPSLSAATRTR